MNFKLNFFNSFIVIPNILFVITFERLIHMILYEFKRMILCSRFNVFDILSFPFGLPQRQLQLNCGEIVIPSKLFS